MNRLQKILYEKNHPAIQFLKYAFCGGIAFAADIIVFYLVAIYVFPSLTPDDVVAKLVGLHLEEIPRELQLRNFWIGKSVSFIGSNLVAYTLNVLFVFKGGKHKRHHEVALFFAVSFLAFFLSTWCGDLLIRYAGAQTTSSNLTAVFFAVMLNYTGRKFLIFRG